VRKLEGKRVLLAEDEAILAMSTEDMLMRLGCSVVGPALSAAEAQALAEREPLDAALLDINMGDGATFSIARILKARGVPICFATGYGAAGLPAEHNDVPVLQKPYTEHALAEMLQQLMR
jgi:CheY-like chemotaxis protein